ncbi:FtsW/RodA/SpoVE family cell cycle protein [Imhoffiella purpurea]|uniref:Cell division protein FtsW n=1 Tax=Imhoffiella purpurea TaxID=1249627 RepID=W9V7M7_9GAMM|nr:FtsW/RodA/SpoVE family cell cycle protein [Imhoffiella purpurea]EXJ15583.1 Cell division protein FtsW [Imhoffiella purpurea]
MQPKPHSRPRTDSLADAWLARWPERQILVWSALTVGLGFLMVIGSGYADGRPTDPRALLPLGLYALSLAIMHLILVSARFQGDQILVGTLAFLAGFGLLAQYRMGGIRLEDLSTPDLYLLPGGVLTMLAVGLALMRGRFERLADWTWAWAGISLVLVALLLVFGHRYRGAVYGAGLVTPTELLKVTVVLFLAGFIDRHGRRLGNWGKAAVPIPPLRALLPLALFWILLAGLLLLQRDLGLFVVLSVTLLLMLFVGTGRRGYLILGALLASAAGYLILEIFAHGQRRIAAWLSPFEDPTGNSWQILQGLSGMYSGGLWGEGFGEGHPEYTPIAQSDFIYAVIGEELGFVGCTLLLIFFLILFGRMLEIADRTRSNFGRLLCVGLTSVLVIQTFLNLGGVTKFIPLTGITLPFISHGGSSLVTGFVSLGLILAISERSPARRQGAQSPRTPTGRLRAARETRPDQAKRARKR